MTGAGTVIVGATDEGSLGTVLTTPDGMTLYTHAGDSMNSSTCTGACLTAWPPLAIAAGQQVAAGPGVTGALASFARSDGSMWVTYAGLPLYAWQGDTKPGDATGQGVEGFTVATVSGGASVSGGSGMPAPSTGGQYHY